MIALRAHDIIVTGTSDLTDFGDQLVVLQGSEEKAHALLAKHILTEMNGLGIIETIREMRSADLKIALTTLPGELRQRGFLVSNNSSDLSGVLGWFKAANLLTDTYDVNETEYTSLMGARPAMIDAMKGLNREQIAFLQAAVALNVTDWTPYNSICKQAESLYPGEIRYNWKEIVSDVVQPLVAIGLIELRKKAKQDLESPRGEGRKSWRHQANRQV